MEDKFPPEHMDTWSRNERLYYFLIQMGHIVRPILVEGTTDKIEALHVTSSLQDGAKRPTETGIGKVMQRPQVEIIVAPTQSLGSNVVKFPAIF